MMGGDTLPFRCLHQHTEVVFGNWKLNFESTFDLLSGFLFGYCFFFKSLLISLGNVFSRYQED